MPTISVISVLYLMTYTCYATQSMAIPYACARDPRGPSRGSRPSQRRTGDGRRSGSNSSWLRPQLGRLSYEPNRRVSALMVIGLAVVSLWLTGCDPVMMSADPPSIVGEWAVYQYRVSITGSSPVDLADGRQITARFNESPQSYFFTYDPRPQGIGLAAELAARDGNYVQNKNRRTLTLSGHSLAGKRETDTTYNYTLSSILRLHFSRSFLRCNNGSCHSGQETVTIMARRK